MKRKSLESQKKGVGGFFVDLPILILVLAVTAVLVTSVYQLYAPFQEEKEEMELSYTCLELKNDIQNYHEIQAEEGEGEFSIQKLKEVDNAEIESYLGSSKDYEYNIFFEEFEGEFKRSFGSNVPDKNEKSDLTVRSYTVPVSLVNREDVSRIGRLKVKVWAS